MDAAFIFLGKQITLDINVIKNNYFLECFLIHCFKVIYFIFDGERIFIRHALGTEPKTSNYGTSPAVGFDSWS